MKKKVIIACTRRYVSEYIKNQLEQLLGDYAEISILLIKQNASARIRCDLVVAISEEVAKSVAPMLMEDTAIIVLRLTIQRDMYARLKEIGGQGKAIVVNNTQELALETVALLYTLDVKNVELFPYFPGCCEDYHDITLAITPNELSHIPPQILQIIDIGERCLDTLTLIEIFSRLDFLNSITIEQIFSYGQNVISINRGITELTRNGHDFGFSHQQFAEGFSDAVLFLDEEQKISILNSAAQELLTESYFYLINRKAVELIPEINVLLREQSQVKNTPITVKGKRFLLTWNFFSGKMKGSSVLILKSMDEMKTLYARYGSERTGRGKLKYSFEDMIGSSDVMWMMKEKAKQFAKTEFPILIQGESGTGKELLAQAIHRESNRKEGPFIAFNCAALTDSLLESELFGYSEGAFTGAKKKGRVGIFELASGGTLFMDEIGDISLNLQTKILRVLQEQEVVPVGGSQVIPIDVRIISATNQDLLQFVKEKKFRLDLYYRLNTLILQTVPLRNRTKDIYDMLPYFFKKNHIKKNIYSEAIEFMMRYPWPGNVREFQNCISYLSVIERNVIRVEDFPEYMLLEMKYSERGIAEKLPLEEMILRVLSQCKAAGLKIGRKKLAERLKQNNMAVTEAEIRRLLEKLLAEDEIVIYKGRGGTQITNKGMDRIQNPRGGIKLETG